jgi:hypothetical protein
MAMADPRITAPAWNTNSRRGRWALVVTLALVFSCVGVGHAKITIRRHSPHDNFFFHGNYSAIPFDPAAAFRLEIWNCADGTMPTFLSAREPVIICAADPQGVDHPLGDLVYAADVPAGVCRDHGRSCYYRNSAMSPVAAGVRYFRVRYARHGHGNRVWLESFGDLSAAQHARMLLVIKVDGLPRAVLEETFQPLPNGGWFSPF